MSSYKEDLNYSICVLIILLLMFWFSCKCIGSNNQYKLKESMKSKTTYGDSNIRIGNPQGLSYIYNNNKEIMVPNSQTAMRSLFDDDAYKCQSLDTINDFDSRPAQIYLEKKRIENFYGKKQPVSMTSTRFKTI
jgi:hypothetical protein